MSLVETYRWSKRRGTCCKRNQICFPNFSRLFLQNISTFSNFFSNHVDTSIFPDLSFRQNRTQLNIYFSLCTTCFGTQALITCCIQLQRLADCCYKENLKELICFKRVVKLRSRPQVEVLPDIRLGSKADQNSLATRH